LRSQAFHGLVSVRAGSSANVMAPTSLTAEDSLCERDRVRADREITHWRVEAERCGVAERRGRRPGMVSRKTTLQLAVCSALMNGVKYAARRRAHQARHAVLLDESRVGVHVLRGLEAAATEVIVLTEEAQLLAP